jgi:GntR family transcriptional regulator, transcriptional repressor for pyruvate dehydrogenase complex
MSGIDLAVTVMGRQESLGDVVYRKMLGQILDGTLPPNSRLPSESALASRYMVSRPVVRQALSRLRDDGFVASRQGSGSFVQYVDPGRANEIIPDGPPIRFPSVSSVADVERYFDFRIGVEAEAAGLAAGLRSAKHIEILTETVDALDGLIESGAIGVEADVDFHMKVARATENYFYIGVMQSLREHMITVMNVAQTLTPKARDDRLRAVQRRHRAVLEAIASGDVAVAQQKMREHLESAKKRLLVGSENHPF